LTNTADQPPSVAKKAPTELASSPRPSRNALGGAWHTRFAVQIDAAMDETSVDQMVGRLQHLGYQPHLITVWVSGKRWYKVEIGPYATRGEAAAADAELRSRYDKAFGGAAEPPTSTG
jgi:cell division septation protein DedD